jgi:hypothetical protein
MYEIAFMAHPLPDPSWCDPLASLNGWVIRSRSIAVASYGSPAR